MVANSTLMTPPPMMTRLSGTSRSRKSSSLVRTPGRSMPGIGRITGLEPAASTTCSAWYTCLSPSFSTSTCLPGRSFPLPSRQVTALALKSCSTPCTS